MRTALRKRLRYLWTWELANGLLVMPGAYLALGQRFRLGGLSLAMLLLVCVLLIVGALFWFLKARSIEGSQRLYQPATRRFFRACKWVFGAALAISLVFLLQALVWRRASVAELVVGGGCFALAALEYVNYYFVQLSYDNRADLAYLWRHRRLKRATMVRELDI